MNRRLLLAGLALIVGGWVSLPAQAQFNPSDLLRLGTGILNQVPNSQAQKPLPPSQPGASISRSQVAEIQSLLGRLGYAAGTPDGKFGPKTRRAIETYQHDAGLPVTGFPDEILLSSLRAAAPEAGSATIAAFAPGPSFDCQKATLATEGAICASAELAALDRQLALSYANAATAAGAGADGLQAAQRQWVEARNTCGADSVCIASAYRSRLAALGGVAGGAVSNGGIGLTAASGFSILNGYDLPNGDYRSGMNDPRLKGISIVACQQACAGDGRCSSFTYNANASVCILKEVVTQRVPFAGAISGIKTAGIVATASTEFDNPSLSPASNPAPAPAEIAMPSGFRSFTPIMSGRRLLTGFPLVHGPYDKERIEFGGGDYVKSSLDLAMLVDLMVLHQFPEILDDPDVAADYARRYLIGDVQAQYYVGCERVCSRSVPYDGWQGANEFEREAAYRAFVSEIGPRLSSATSATTAEVLRITEVELLPYDTERQSFPVRFRRPAPGLFGYVEPASRARLGEVVGQPAELPMARDQAQAFVARFPEDRRLAYVGTYETLGTPEWDKRLDRPSLPLTTTAERLYSDPLGQNLLFDFTAAEQLAEGTAPDTSGADGAAWAATMARALGIEMYEGRLVVRGANGGSRVPEETTNAIGRWAAALVLSQSPDVLNDDETAFDYLKYVPEPAQSEILRTGVAEPDKLDPAKNGYWHNLDEFDRRGLLQAIRAGAAAAISAGAPPLPLPIIALCWVSIDEYDFDAERFPIRAGAVDDCDSVPVSVSGYGDLDIGNVNIGAPLAIEDLPDTIGVPLAQARDYRRTNVVPDDYGNSSTLYAIAASISGLREVPDKDQREFELVVDMQGVLLFPSGDLTVPFERLPLNATPSVATVPARPAGPVMLDDPETISLLLISKGIIAVEDHGLELLRARASTESSGRPGAWAPFFHVDTVRALGNGQRQPEPELLANFIEWTRQRVTALPGQLRYESGSGELKYLVDDEVSGVISPLIPGGSSDEDSLARAAARAGVPTELAAAIDNRWEVNGPEIPGLGSTDIVMMLPQAPGSYTVAVDPTLAAQGVSVDVVVDVRIDNVNLAHTDDGNPMIVLQTAPLAFQVVAKDGTEVASVTFDSAAAPPADGPARAVSTAQPAPKAIDPQLLAAAEACPGTMIALVDAPARLVCTCSSVAGGSVWGTDLYTADSDLCTAAVHAGAISEAGGAVLVERAPGSDSYTGSSRNGVNTSDWGSYQSSIRFLAGAALPAATDVTATRLASDDVLGIRMGMRVAEAEQIIRENMPIGWVGISLEPEDEGDRIQDALKPFTDLTVYIGADRREQIVLFKEDETSDRIAGVARVVPVQAGTSLPTIAESLLKKYGSEPVERSDQGNYIRLIWTVDSGGFEDDVCETQLERLRPTDLRFVEGEVGDDDMPDDLNDFASAPGLYVWGGRVDKPPMTTWDASQWSTCGPTVIAEIRAAEYERPTYLTVAIFDLAAYAEGYTRHVATTKPAEVVPKL